MGDQASSQAPGARKRPTIEVEQAGDGQTVIPAEGSVWQLYFPAGFTPTEDQVRAAVGALGAVKAMQAGNLAYTTWDGAADPDMVDIVNFSGASVISREARDECVRLAERADAFNERVMQESTRIADERIEQAREAMQAQLDQYSDDLEVAEKLLATISHDNALLMGESAVLTKVVEAAGVKPELIEAARNEARENSVLPNDGAAGIVEDVEGQELIPDPSYMETTVLNREGDK